MVVRVLVAAYRIGFAVLAAVALAYAFGHRAPGASAANYFSFFTILSNILGTGVLLYGGVATAAGWPPVPDALRGAAALYLAATGVVYGLLLTGLDPGNLAEWVNTTLHRIMPVVLVADWLLVPPDRPVRWRRAAWWLAFPVCYLVYALLRGPLVHWYPYPFVDPRPHGYGHVAIMCVGVAAGFLLISALLVLAGNALSRRRSGRVVADRPAVGRVRSAPR
jgi:hypothetical protein